MIVSSNGGIRAVIATRRAVIGRIRRAVNYRQATSEIPVRPSAEAGLSL
jgi:hypothetical protein